MSGLKFWAESLGVVVVETVERVECHSTTSPKDGGQHFVTET